MFVESSMEEQVDIVLVNGITLCDNGNIASMYKQLSIVSSVKNKSFNMTQQ